MTEDEQRKQDDDERYQRTGVESYDQKLERWKEGWTRELEDDLRNER